MPIQRGEIYFPNKPAGKLSDEAMQKVETAVRHRLGL
jgi:hypothetical protein